MTGPRPVLGTMTFGDTVSPQNAARMIDLAHERGVVDLDTANGYSGGESERIVGAAISRWPGDFRVATKAGIPHPDAEGRPPLSRDALRSCLRGSLKRMGVDRVDLFYLHQPDPETPVEETVDALAELVDAGQVGEIGVSNFAAWQISELIGLMDRAGLGRPAVGQQLYNLLARRIENEYVAFALAAGIDTRVYNPLGGGLLSGRHRFDALPSEGRFGSSRLSAMYRERYWDQRLFEAVVELTDVATSAGMPLPELAIRWLASRPVVTSMLIGASSRHHLEANLDALASGPLPEDVLAACERVGERLHGPMPAYNR